MRTSSPSGHSTVFSISVVTRLVFLGTLLDLLFQHEASHLGMETVKDRYGRKAGYGKRIPWAGRTFMDI